MITETDKKYDFATDCRILALILHFLSTMSIVNKLVLTVRGQDIQSTNQKLTKASRDLTSHEFSLIVCIMFTFLIASRSEWFIGVICCNCPDVTFFFFFFGFGWRQSLESNSNLRLDTKVVTSGS